MTENNWTVEPRLTGFIKHQSGGLSFIHCRDIEGLVRFFTIDATGDVTLGATVTFELSPYMTDPRYAANIIVISDAPGIGSYHLVGDGSVQDADTPDDSALLGPIAIPGQNVNAFFARAAASVRDYSGHECSTCGTRWQSPDYASCPRCADDRTPLDDNTLGLLEHAESVADGLEDGAPVLFIDEDLPGDSDTGAVMFLDFQQAEFMRQCARFDGMLVYLHQIDAIRMALDLEEGGLVTIERTGEYWVVSAVRGEEE